MGKFSKKLYAVVREAVNFLESSVFGQFMGRAQSKYFRERKATNYFVGICGVNNFVGILTSFYFVEICDANYFPKIRRTQKISRDYIRFTT